MLLGKVIGADVGDNAGIEDGGKAGFFEIPFGFCAVDQFAVEGGVFGELGVESDFGGDIGEGVMAGGEPGFAAGGVAGEWRIWYNRH